MIGKKHKTLGVVAIPRDKRRKFSDSQSALTYRAEAKHMSATQDASDLAENVVALDAECRDYPVVEACKKFVTGDCFLRDGKLVGLDPIYEDQRFKLAGVDVQADGVVRIILLTDEPNPDPEDPVKWHLDPTKLEDSFPEIYAQVESLVPRVTDARDLSDLRHRVHQTFAGKPALHDVLRQTLKVGRRSYLELKAEEEEVSQADFYDSQKDFGSF